MTTTIKSGPVTEARAREIMGKNFFGTDEAVNHFFVVPTEEQMEFISKVPFSEETLLECKDTHILVAVFPLSILDIKAVPLNIHIDTEYDTVFRPQDWYHDEAFAKDKGEVGWQLIRRVPVAGSMSKMWNDQRSLLSKDEEVSTARIMVYAMVGHFLASGERLFGNVCIRCVELKSDGSRVGVGGFDICGLRIRSWHDKFYDIEIGVSAARKRDY